MTKSQLIKMIQYLPGVVTVEGQHTDPSDPNELFCIIEFLPIEIPEQLTIQEISRRNYEATKRRGLITDKTELNDFLDKIEEEVSELHESFDYLAHGENCEIFDPKELADIALVCFAMAEHYGIDLVKEMEEKMKYNEVRK